MESFNYLRVPPELLQAVLDNPYEGTIIIDSSGIIRHFSKANEPFYGVTADEILGRHILDVIPTSGLPGVVRTGRAQVGDAFSVAGRHVIVNRYPIKVGNKVIGAVGKVIFHDLKALSSLKQKVKKLESTLKKYESEIRINCASIPGELFESELFGYEPGAFTGAIKSGKPGKFELAHKGTILLDEIGLSSWPPCKAATGLAGKRG